MILITRSKIAFAVLAPVAVVASIAAAVGYGTHKASAPADIVLAAEVTPAQYESAVRQAFSGFRTGDAAAVISLRDGLLKLRVPATERTVHFALVSKLTAYADAIRTGRDPEGVLALLAATADGNAWLRGIPPFTER